MIRVNIILILILILLTVPIVVGQQLNVSFNDANVPRVIINPLIPPVIPINQSFNQSFTDTTYLRLDTTNDPLTGSLDFNQNDIFGIDTIDGGSFVDLHIKFNDAPTNTIQFVGSGGLPIMTLLQDDLLFPQTTDIIGVGNVVMSYDCGTDGQFIFGLGGDARVCFDGNNMVLETNRQGNNDLNVTRNLFTQGNISVMGTSLTVDGNEVCQNDSSNCPTDNWDNTNVAYLNNTQTFTEVNTFSNNVTIETFIGSTNLQLAIEPTNNLTWERVPSRGGLFWPGTIPSFDAYVGVDTVGSLILTGFNIILRATNLRLGSGLQQDVGLVFDTSSVDTTLEWETSSTLDRWIVTQPFQIAKIYFGVLPQIGGTFDNGLFSDALGTTTELNVSKFTITSEGNFAHNFDDKSDLYNVNVNNANFSDNGTFGGSSLIINGNEVCQSDGTNCLTSIDTNATTECSGDEVLLGNGTCFDISDFGSITGGEVPLISVTTTADAISTNVEMNPFNSSRYVTYTYVNNSVNDIIYHPDTGHFEVGETGTYLIQATLLATTTVNNNLVTQRLKIDDNIVFSHVTAGIHQVVDPDDLIVNIILDLNVSQNISVTLDAVSNILVQDGSSMTIYRLIRQGDQGVSSQSQPSRSFNTTFTNNNGATLFVYGSIRNFWQNTGDSSFIDLYSNNVLVQRVGRHPFGRIGAAVNRNETYPFNMIVLDGDTYSINTTITGSSNITLEFWNEAF